MHVLLAVGLFLGDLPMAKQQRIAQPAEPFRLHSPWGDILDADIAQFDGTEARMVFILSEQATKTVQHEHANWLDFSAPGVGGSNWTFFLGSEAVLSVEFVENIAARIPPHPYFQFFRWPDQRIGFVFFAGAAREQGGFSKARQRVASHFSSAGKTGQRWDDDRYRQWLESCFKAVGIQPQGAPKDGRPAPISLLVRGSRTGRYRAMVMVQTLGVNGGGRIVATESFEAHSAEATVVLTPDQRSWPTVAQKASRQLQWNVEVTPQLTPEEAEGVGPLRLAIQFGSANAPGLSTTFPW
jgi:hypothetical protein